MLDQSFGSLAAAETGVSQPHAKRQSPAPELSLVIPVHNEVENVDPLIGEIAEALATSYCFEAIVVDDGSTDGTAEALTAAAGSHPWLRVLHHPRRCGKSAGVRSGVMAARAPVVVMLDGDRQNDPADIPRLFERLRGGQGEDPRLAMVAGQRTRRRDTLVRRLSSRIANGVRGALLKDGTRDTGCGLKAITREAYLRLPFFDGQHRFMSALVRAQGYTLSLEPVNDRPRVAGRAKYGIWNRLWVGIGDLLAVFWLIRRCRLPERVVEMTPEQQVER